MRVESNEGFGARIADWKDRKPHITAHDERLKSIPLAIRILEAADKLDRTDAIEYLESVEFDGGGQFREDIWDLIYALPDKKRDKRDEDAK